VRSEADGFSPRRIVTLAGALVALGAIGELILRRSPAGALSLTGAGLVAIINFRWLEDLLHRVIQPGEPRIDRWSLLRFIARIALLGAVLAAVVLVPRVDPIGIALGFSALVIALLVEAMRWARFGGG
jgi:hypothetical protein